MPRRAEACRAFTIVDLLVVIAILPKITNLVGGIM
jgi:Tfp pilus assembly protein FimT